MTRKAQQSCREQPATPSSGSVTPRGEVIHRDTKEKLEPAERRQREDTRQTQRHTATDRSASPSVKPAERTTTGDTFNLKASCQLNNRDRRLRPERRHTRARRGGSRIKLLPPCLCVSGGKEQEGVDGSGSGKTCLCGGAFVEIKDYHA